MTTHDLRVISGESQREFAEHYHIPVATVRNWDSRGSMPEYVHYIIDLLQRTEGRMNEAVQELAGIFYDDQNEDDRKEVIADGVWWDKYSEAPDLYRDPYNDDCAD